MSRYSCFWQEVFWPPRGFEYTYSQLKVLIIFVLCTTHVFLCRYSAIYSAYSDFFSWVSSCGILMCKRCLLYVYQMKDLKKNCKSCQRYYDWYSVFSKISLSISYKYNARNLDLKTHRQIWARAALRWRMWDAIIAVWLMSVVSTSIDLKYVLYTTDTQIRK